MTTHYPTIQIHTDAEQPSHTLVTLEGVPLESVVNYTVEQSGTHNKPLVTLTLYANVQLMGTSELRIRLPFSGDSWRLVREFGDDTE